MAFKPDPVFRVISGISVLLSLFMQPEKGYLSNEHVYNDRHVKYKLSDMCVLQALICRLQTPAIPRSFAFWFKCHCIKIPVTMKLH